MKYLSILFLIFSFLSSAQRVEFKDPDLTFSFIKPDNWMMNDGLTVFVIPDDESFENPSIFFSITYFESPISEEVSENIFHVNEIESSISSDLLEFDPYEEGKEYIADEVAMWTSYFHTQADVRLKAVSYIFMKLDQRFEVTISAPVTKYDEFEPQFQSMLKSISIKE